MMMSLFDQDEVTNIRIAAKEREAQQKALQEGIQGAITIMRDLGLPDREIAEKIRDQYGLTEEEADKLLAVKA
ncbi:MAG: hypothetical protein VZQ80_06700 [Lachnospiraceae bacterium]|nr:hypothetical protein [Lachnospiraceae bacterium]